MLELKKYKMFINGEWVNSDTKKTFETLNPENNKPWAVVPEASASDVDRAVKAAQNAFEGEWPKLLPKERARYLRMIGDKLRENAEHLGKIETIDTGKLYRETYKQAHKKQKYGRFIKFAKISLKGYNLWDDQLNNAAVRDTQNKDYADENIAYSYKKDGWSYSSFPPIISTDGSIKDGRTRIRAALLAGWDQILVAIFSYDEEKVDSEFASITNLSLIHI